MSRWSDKIRDWQKEIRRNSIFSLNETEATIGGVL